MLFRFRKYLSVVALFLFLFPTVTEEVHAYMHRNDFHCTAKTEKHLHQQGHHCAICDFVPLIYDKPSFDNHIEVYKSWNTIFFAFHPVFIVVKNIRTFSLRAPPDLT